MTTVPAPASPDEALAMLRAGMSYLAAADPTALAAQTQTDCLQALEQLDAVETASQGYSADADYSPTAWLIHRTKVTKGAARGHLGWARRVQAHPQVAAALDVAVRAGRRGGHPHHVSSGITMALQEAMRSL